MAEYVKFISETQIKYAPRNLGSICNFNKNPEVMLAHGYKPLIVTSKPPAPHKVTYKETAENI